MPRSYAPRHAVRARHLHAGKGQHRSPFWPTGKHRAPSSWPSIDALAGERGPGRTVTASMLCALSLAGLAQGRAAAGGGPPGLAAADPAQVTLSLSAFALPPVTTSRPAPVPPPAPATPRPPLSSRRTLS